ncbi:AT hook containing transcription factor 1 homolog isoform X2 [Leptinotarsa decemlineata]|uniref:AT hook containing transcription factor 1 homolog isoform X2 n=1 Tax=Leptinotarsa decemlineata TaxID=7539 RepID=UPI003D3081D7
MSLSINKVLPFRHPTLEFVPHNEYNVVSSEGLPLSGRLLQDTRHVWHAKGPSLEVRNAKTGCKVGAWTFGYILKDSNTSIVCVEEIRRPHGRLSLLAVGIDCAISGGLVCIFDVFSSKVIRAIQIKEKISYLHVIDPGIEDLNLPGPLRNFDGILAVGTDGGCVILIDICRQICEEALFSTTRKDELNPCQLVLLTSKNIPKIEYYKERSMRDGTHLAIHLNAVLDSLTEHFILKGPKGDDRIYVNKEEVITSGLYYCPQLTSLLVGYNFGAFQLWDLTTLTLVYTSPVCEGHLPVTKFALQEPADDPRAFCYVWVSYSKSEVDQSGLPLVVMYSLCYESKEFHEGYGFLYQDFQHCSVRFQVELGPLEEVKHGPDPKWGQCLGLQPISKIPPGKEHNSRVSSGDNLALCLISWTVWFGENINQTNILIFDLNQWYKEQMPNFSRWKNCSNYLLRLSLTDMIHITGNGKTGPLLDVALDPKSLAQFVGVQRLEEHFYPTSLSFDLLVLRENDVVLFHNRGLQQALLHQIESTGPLCLLKPSEVSRQVLSLGLTPLFSEESLNSSFSTGTQREIILNVGLEHQLVGWLCKCAFEWANGSFSSAGCSLDFLLNWAFQRAVSMKTHCDRYCAPLFDHSQSQLDNNTTVLLNSCIRQINNLCVLYSYIINKLSSFLSCPDLVEEQRRSLQMVSVYFEVLQWLVNIGLLPEYAPSMYPRNSDKIGAPYPVQELTKFYNDKRTELQLLNEETFASKDSLLFIDNLINRNCGGSHLQAQWREDNGNGLYPPPSLQSLIRTYLVDVAEIKHKHSLVIYLFLDLAMALEKSRYSPVITYLIKFPAVFKVSTSVIKITQAFWQLDHGDFATAMEQLLDPFVLGEDLQPWQHTIAMRSLCVQKQYNFALLYIQTRKPPMTDHTDFLTAISLFVANKMLDEAFYFMKQHRNGADEDLLMHLFEECKKNDCLHDLLYKNLGSGEEQAFIKYLKNANSASSDELQVFYYLLRSRYLEAFDYHAGVVRNNGRQGLIGQSNVSTTDQVVRIFKSLLPDVNRNLVEYVRKERTNLWKEVSRPTPLSVFVHNTNEQIQYKSTLIHAALAKAKHTFQDNLNETKFNELLTEETPFLRTPKAFKNGTRMTPNIITPNVIEFDENGEGFGPSPPKKLKLTPRLSTGSPPKMNVSVHAIMLTPIVRRKTSLQQDQSNLSSTIMNVCTPQGILKGRNIEEEEDAGRSDRKSGIGLRSRRSVSRTPRPQHVQFQDSFSDLSSKPAESTALEDQILQKSSLSSKDISCMVSSKESSRSTNDDVFYSPNTSLEELSHEKEQQEFTNLESTKLEGDSVKEDEESREIERDPSPNESAVESPRGRRSYKRSFKEMSPVRSSPRLAKNTSSQVAQQLPKISQDDSATEGKKIDVSASNSERISEDSTPPVQSPRLLLKVKGRRSLSRQVLEQNTFLRLCTPMKSDTTVSKETTFSKTEKTVSEEKSPRVSRTTTVETSLKISDVSRSSLNSPATQKIHNVSGSVTRKQDLEISTDFDSSMESDASFELSTQNKVPELEISDSVHEYMKSVYAKLAAMQKKNSSQDLLKPDTLSQTSNVENSETGQVEVEMSNEEVGGSSVEAPPIEDNKTVSEENMPNVSQNKSADQLEREASERDSAGSSQNKDKSEEVISMEIYEDLSSGADDKQSCTEDHSGFDELEVNVFGITESAATTPSKKMEQSSASSSEGSIPETEKAFIEYTPEKKVSGNEEVIVINSSEDDEEASNSSSINLQVSFEQNIQAHNRSEASSQSSDSEEGEYHSVKKKCLEDNEMDDVVENVDAPVMETEELDKEVEGEEAAASLDVGESHHGPEKVSSEEINKSSARGTSAEDFSTTEEVHEVKRSSEPKGIDEGAALEDLEDLQGPTGRETIISKERDDETKDTMETVTQESTNSKATVKEVPVKVSATDCQKKLVPPELTATIEDTKMSKKKDQFTNTSFSSLDTTDGELETEDTDKSTKVDGGSGTNKVEQSSQTARKSLAQESFVGEVDWSTNQRVYPPRVPARTNAEDSSSDTTEGETVRQDLVVTAQVHATSKKKIEQPLIKRVTRRSVSLMSQGPLEAPKDGLQEGMDDKQTEDVFTPEKPKSRVASPSRCSTRTSKPRRLSQCSSSTIDCEMNTSKETLEAPKVATLLRKTRSASVDEVKTYSRKRTLKRSNSVEGETAAEIKPKLRGKARSVSQMPVISEEAKSQRGSKEVYASSRRLTRRQASIVKGVPTPAELTAEDEGESVKPLELEGLDPIKLLDKEPFQGEPDPEEKKVYQVSPSPSNSTAGSINKPARRKSRSASVVSDISLPPSVSEPPTPEKRPRKTRSQAGSPKTPTGVKTRSRKHSETSSIASAKSDPATPPKRSRKKQTEDSEASTSMKRTRSRADSVSSAHSDATESPRKNLRARRLVSAKSDLPEITEEKVDESASQKKNTRKKN